MKTANKCYQATVEAAREAREWFLVDAADKTLGRLAAKIATILMGKHKPTYTPHVDTGDYVIVVNADKVKVTGRKREQEVYMTYSRYPSGHHEWTMEEVFKRHPERVLYEAVRRMLPKNALARHMLLKLKLYNGNDHPHQAQNPKAIAL